MSGTTYNHKKGIIIICHFSMLASVRGIKETKLSKTQPLHFCRLWSSKWVSNVQIKSQYNP